MNADDRLRLRPGPRPSQLLLERDGAPFGELNVGRGAEIVLLLGRDEYRLMTGDGWDVQLCTPDGDVVATHDDRRLRDDLIVADGREYTLELPDEDDDGELRAGPRVARLEIRHPEQGSVLLVDVVDAMPDLVVVFAATVGYLRCGSMRRERRFGPQHIQAQMTAGTFSAAISAGGCNVSGV